MPDGWEESGRPTETKVRLTEESIENLNRYLGTRPSGEAAAPFTPPEQVEPYGQCLNGHIARGLYYQPISFRNRPIEWEETVHADIGMLGLTTKHLYFAGARKKFRVRYDKIVSFEPYSDGLGIMRDAQTAKPQTFRTGDGWFAYNLAANLAQIQG